MGRGAAGGMARTSSGRKGHEDTRSDPGLLTPLQATGHPEAMEPADVRPLVEAIEDLKQVAQNVLASIQVLRTDLGQYEERQAGSISDIRETQAAIQQGIGDLVAKLDTGDALRDALGEHARELRDAREAVERLTRFVESAIADTVQSGSACNRADASRSDLEALDAWRDDFIRHVNALLIRVENEAGVPVTGASAPEETALAHVDRITARMALLEGEVGKAAAKMDEAVGTVTTSLSEHGETMRRAEGSSLLTRKQVEFLRTAFDRKEREYRRLRHLWVSLPVILVVAVAGMVLESRLHWLYRLLG